MSNPYDYVYIPTRPDLTITNVRSTSTQRGYHQTWYDVVSRHPLDADDFARLDDCGLLGMGQEYRVADDTIIIDTVPCVAVEKLTGIRRPDVVHPHTGTTMYTYQHYTVLRICDSGD